MTAVAANWYPDPQNPAQQRWWNGLQWTAETRPVFAPPATAQGPYVSAFPETGPIEPKIAASTALLRLNRVGFVGVALGIGSLILNPFCGVSVAAIILCGLGFGADAKLRAAGKTRTGRGWLIAGLVVAVLVTVWYAVNTLRLLCRSPERSRP